MTIDKITITCSECGNEFKHRKDCYNRREADRYEAWAAKNITICPDCLRKIRAAEAAVKAERIIAELNIPREITGVSEKQIAYAIARRNEYIARCDDILIDAAKQLQKFKEQHGDIKENAVQLNLTFTEMVNRILLYHGGRSVYIILTSSSAREILDALNN